MEVENQQFWNYYYDFMNRKKEKFYVMVKYKSAKIIRIPKPFFCCESEISVVFGGHCAEYRFGGESRQTKTE